MGAAITTREHIMSTHDRKELLMAVGLAAATVAASAAASSHCLRTKSLSI